MTTTYYLHYIAAAYGSGNYNANNYNGSNATAAGLSNTGIAVGLVVGAAALILLVALGVRVMKRPGKKPADFED